jgi:hypothetical protein
MQGFLIQRQVFFFATTVLPSILKARRQECNHADMAQYWGRASRDVLLRCHLSFSES